MTKFIGVEILAANALINEIEHQDKDFITVDKAIEYSKGVSDILTKKGHKNVVLFDSSRFEDCEYLYKVDLEKDIIKKNDGVSVELLRDRFRGPLNLDVLTACMEEETILNNENQPIA